MAFFFVCVAVIIVFLLWFFYNNQNNTQATSAGKVNSNFVETAFSFFDGYLSFCQNHNVVGKAILVILGRETSGINVKMQCDIQYIDNKKAYEELNVLKLSWSKIKRNKENYQDSSLAGDEYIQSYFGCDNLHWVFTEIDEYDFNYPNVSMSFESTMFTLNGESWGATLISIEQEILKKYPNTTICIDNNGIAV